MKFSVSLSILRVMPAKKKNQEINLLPKEAWETGVLGKLLHWALSVGRYVVVFTELIVISAFLFRFGLDRKLNDLNEEMTQKKSVISSFGNLEEEFRLVQKKLKATKTIKDEGLNVEEILEAISQMTPLDTSYSSISIRKDGVNLEGQTLSDVGLATLIATSQNDEIFSNVILENVASAKEKSQAINFRMILEMESE